MPLLWEQHEAQTFLCWDKQQIEQSAVAAENTVYIQNIQDTKLFSILPAYD